MKFRNTPAMSLIEAYTRRVSSSPSINDGPIRRRSRSPRRSRPAAAISGRGAAQAQHRHLARLSDWRDGDDLSAASEPNLARWLATHCRRLRFLLRGLFDACTRLVVAHAVRRD